MTKTFFFLSFGAGASVGVSVFFSAAAGAAASGAGAACFCRTRQGGDQYVRMRAWYHASMRVRMQIWQAAVQPSFGPSACIPRVHIPFSVSAWERQQRV